MSRSTLIALSLVILAGAAHAETYQGRLEEPALRRKAQLVYVEKASLNAAAPAQAVFMNQHGNTYVPHVLPIIAGTKIVFRSEDPELHNVYARGEKRVLFNDAVLPHMQSQPKAFTEPGEVHLTCNVHKEMSAWVIVLQNGFFALPQKDGTFKIDGLPAGSYTLRVWGEELSEEQKAKKIPITVGKSS